jgi:hypothetical protein
VTPETAQRLHELARQGALHEHLDAIYANEAGHDHHGESDEHLGFETCLHPDCVLVRAEGVARSPEGWQVGDVYYFGGRNVRVVCVEPHRVGIRSVTSNRLSYVGTVNFKAYAQPPIGVPPAPVPQEPQ